MTDDISILADSAKQFTATYEKWVGLRDQIAKLQEDADTIEKILRTGEYATAFNRAAMGKTMPRTLDVAPTAITVPAYQVYADLSKNIEFIRTGRYNVVMIDHGHKVFIARASEIVIIPFSVMRESRSLEDIVQWIDHTYGFVYEIRTRMINAVEMIRIAYHVRKEAIDASMEAPYVLDGAGETTLLTLSTYSETMMLHVREIPTGLLLKRTGGGNEPSPHLIPHGLLRQTIIGKPDHKYYRTILKANYDNNKLWGNISQLIMFIAAGVLKYELK